MEAEFAFERLHPFVAVASDDKAVALRLLEPSGLKIASVVAVYAFPLGALDTSMIQFAPSVDFVTLIPSACGVPPGPLIKPETITYRTAASTTVIATIRMVAITGDTALSSFRTRRTFFIV